MEQMEKTEHTEMRVMPLFRQTLVKGAFREGQANWTVCPTFAMRFSSFQGVTTAT
jgi:hypothetical protein